ncbi:MAG TPA: PIN domain-containing protein [Nitrospiria bacterium]|nr:PIN domain-containing protein [Nitrospiria bacterium]HUK57275.1 PIN domain-containing protein [Nitrospiria bacterium]
MVIRIIFLFLCGLAGLFLFGRGLEVNEFYLIGIMGGLLTAASGLLIEQAIRRVPSGIVLGSTAGLLIGIVAAGAIGFTANSMLPDFSSVRLPVQLFLLLLFGYLGVTIGRKIGGELQVRRSSAWVRTGPSEPSNKILDTSVIIEGRIADLCETGFLEGTFIIPQFILHELQHIADSSDSLKRARGRRGLDVLHRIQKMVDIDVRIVENDFPHIRNVDAKLVALGKEIDAKIITNDLNLNKVAELQGVRVLNINELSNSLKPVVLPGEVLRVFILKEGKEAGQGVAYLDDGTMIVVDNAKRLIGKNIDVVVTSVLQTTAGRMIFTRLREGSEKEKEEVHVTREHA